MDQPNAILDALTRITERADIFRHGCEELFAEINLTEVHCLHWIGTLDHPNVTKVAHRMQMTRGAITKITRKLMGRAFIESFREPGNGKEIYFRLSGGGLALFEEHRQQHEQARKEKLALLQDFDPGEQAAILGFLEGVNLQLDTKLRTRRSGS